MTLVEVMVALVLLMITMLPLGYLVTNEVHQAASAKNRLAALGIAEKWVEILGSAQDPPPNLGTLAVDTGTPLIPKLPTGVSVPTEVIGGTLFTIRSEYTWSGTEDGSAPDLCTAGGAQVLNLQVTVSWGINQQITDTTILDYPPAGIPEYGFYRLQISGAQTAHDSAGNPWSSRVKAIPVVFTPSGYPSLPPIYPDQYGCVFAELSPGTYTVSVSDPLAGFPLSTDSYGNPSFVENLGTDGSPEPTGPFTYPVSITAGVTNSLANLSYDEGSTIGLSYPSSTATEDGVTCPGTGQITCLSEGEGTPGSLGAALPLASLASTSGSTWSSAVLPSSPSSTRIASVACATAACIGVGYGWTGTTPHGVIISDNTTTPSTVTADTVPSGVTSLTQVICPTTTACVAWGVTSSGPVVLAGTILSSGDTWNTVTLPPGMTTLNQVACTPAPLDCVAVGSGGLWGWAASGPLYGSAGAPSAGTWVAPIVPITGLGNPPDLTQVACPSAGVCMAMGTGQILGVLGLGPVVPIVVSALFNPIGPGTIAWTPDLYPLLAPIPDSLSQLVCLPSNTCLAVGTLGAQAVIYSGTAGLLAPLFLTPDSVPSSASSISQLTCPSSSVCVAIGSGSAGPVILSGAIGSPDIWSPAAGIQAGISSVSSLSCPNATTCAIAASDTSSANPAAAILYGAPGSSATWTEATLPAADASALYLTGISCTPTSGTSTCSAVGASPTNGVIVMSTGGPGGPWNDDTSDPGLALTGSPTSNIPIELSNGFLINGNPLITGAWNPVPATPVGTANTTSIHDIFPFASGYGVFAGDCVSETTAFSAISATAATVPGNTVPATPGATVPLAVLPVQVNSASGAPESGDVLTLTALTPGCLGDTYDLQPTGPDGLSRTEVPFGTYSLTVTSGSSSVTVPNLVVGPGTVTVGSTVYSLPQPETVVGP